jgi:DNA-binding transcriptional LysR family regulator
MPDTASASLLATERPRRTSARDSKLIGALADRLPGVVEVEAEQVGAAPGPIPSRDMWMIVHRAKQREPKVRAVMRWLEGIDWLYMPLTINQLTPSRTSSNSE